MTVSTWKFYWTFFYYSKFLFIHWRRLWRLSNVCILNWIILAINKKYFFLKIENWTLSMSYEQKLCSPHNRYIAMLTKRKTLCKSIRLLLFFCTYQQWKNRTFISTFSLLSAPAKISEIILFSILRKENSKLNSTLPSTFNIHIIERHRKYMANIKLWKNNNFPCWKKFSFLLTTLRLFISCITDTVILSKLSLFQKNI